MNLKGKEGGLFLSAALERIVLFGIAPATNQKGLVFPKLLAYYLPHPRWKNVAGALISGGAVESLVVLTPGRCLTTVIGLLVIQLA